MNVSGSDSVNMIFGKSTTTQQRNVFIYSMESHDKSRLMSTTMPDVNNIVLFVGDAVRHDTAESTLSSMGPTYKTIAASLHTPASFGSLLTGLNVPSHGVFGFQNTLSDTVPSLVDLGNHNTYFSNKTGTMHDDLHRIFSMYNNCSIDDAEPPFIWIARDPGGHAPYDGYDWNTYDQKEENAQE